MINPWKLLTRTEKEFSEDHCDQMAAAIAYQALFSFIPLITILLAVLGLVMRDPQQQRDAVDRMLAALPLLSGTLIDDSLRSVSSQTGALTIIGVLGLLWAASGLFGAVRVALNIAWDAKAKPGFVAGKVHDLGAMLGLGILLVASLAGTVTIQFLQTSSANPSGGIVGGSLHTLLMALGMVVPAALSFVTFLLLYRYVPNVRHGIGDVWPGALVATILFEVAKYGFAYYLSHFNHYQALYGALGAVMLFMLFTHLSAMIMLIGAELASEYEAMRRGRPVEHESAVFLHEPLDLVGR